jgi:divalent metal cation (Fe/Co/Zn/Cd) transporter
MGSPLVASSSSKLVIFTAIAGSGAIAITKFVVAGISGSSAILAEAIHSVLDTFNQVLLLHGQRRSRHPPDDLFPFGYGTPARCRAPSGRTSCWESPPSLKRCRLQ